MKDAKHTPGPWKITRPHPDPETAAYLVEIFPATGGFDGPHSTQAIAYLYCAKAGTTQAANADLIVRAVNNHAALLAALREALTQLDYYNAETRETSRWAEWHSTLAAAQTIPSGESRKCAKCGFNISEYAVGEILCGACLNDQPCALCGHSYEAHEPDMQCHDGEAHGNRCACRTFVPSGEKEGK